MYKMITCEDDVNVINNESYAEYLDTQSMKNKILNIKNEVRKQELWNKLFPPVQTLEVNEVY